MGQDHSGLQPWVTGQPSSTILATRSYPPNTLRQTLRLASVQLHLARSHKGWQRHKTTEELTESATDATHLRWAAKVSTEYHEPTVSSVVAGGSPGEAASED